MMAVKDNLGLLTFLIFSALIFSLLFYFGQNSLNQAGKETRPANNNSLVSVKRVVDGDTIILENGQSLRYIGIDSPEIDWKGKNYDCYAWEARKANEKLVLGRPVRLEKDMSEKDKYGRLLRYVYAGDLFVNEVLVRQGFARAAAYPPDLKYQPVLNLAEKQAQENKVGLWTNCVYH